MEVGTGADVGRYSILSLDHPDPEEGYEINGVGFSSGQTGSPAKWLFTEVQGK